MTDKIFWEDPYLTELETRVARADGGDVVLERTIFYALSGGQESDRGTIGGHPVLEAQKRGRDIVYTLPADHGLTPGQAVTVAIDWPRRYRLMRLHFAAELVLELVYRRFEGIEKIGAHIGPEKARIDFRLDTPVSEALPALRAEAQEIVDSDRTVTSDFSDRPTERRYWQIEGFPPVPCGGTHVRRTGEIGDIALKRKNIGKGKERIEITIANAPA